MRFNKWQFFILIFLLTGFVTAQNKVSGLVDGEVWTVDQSPIHVSGDLTVLQLTIEPGVKVLFDGFYRMTVSGLLKAAGNKQDSIIFQAAPSNASGWAGIYFNDADANSLLQYCRISDVTTNPALEVNGNNLTVQHTVVSQNQASGLHILNSVVTLERCTVRDNDQQGLLMESDGRVNLIACTILNNADKGLETNSGQINIKNSIVAFNQQEGIVLSGSGDALTCTNSVIAYNNKEGIINVDGTHNIKNSIIYFNQATRQIVKLSGSGDINYSDVAQTDLGGSGNITDDPLFTDSSTFELSAASPAIDAGDPSASDNDRYFPPSKGDRRNDMGAYGGPLARKWFPPLFTIPDSLDFGKVSLGDSLTLNLVLKNYSDNTLNIAQIALAGNDAQHFKLSGSFENINLAMADSLLIPVVFRPRQTSSLPYRAQLLISSDLDQKSIPLSGTVVTANIFTLPDELTFDDVAVSEADSQVIKIFNTGTDSLFIDSLRFTASSFSARLPDTVLEPYSQNYLPLTVVFKPDTIGSTKDTLHIFSNDPDDSPLLIPVAGNGLAPVMRLSHTFLQFDSVQVYSDSALTFEILNAGNSPLLLSDMNFVFSDSPFRIDFGNPLQIEPQSSSGPLQVHFSPDSTLPFTDTLLISGNDPFKGVQKLPVAGTGIGAFLQIPVQTVDFGQLAMPGDSLIKLTIKNSGNIDLKIEALGISGEDASSFNWWKVSGDLVIAPENDSLQIYIRCKPQKSGPLQASLTVVSNDVLHGTFELPLAGFVKAAELALQPDTVRFDSTMIFSQRSTVVKIFNRGDYLLKIDSVALQINQNSDLNISAFNVPVQLQPRIDTLSIPITFQPRQVGIQKATLSFYSNDPFQNPRLLTITGQAVEARLVLTEDTLDFGRSSLFREQTRLLWLQNNGNAPVIIDSIVLNDTSAFSLLTSRPSGVPAKASVPLNVRFHPPTKGHFEAGLTIFWNNPYKQPAHALLMGEADSARLVTAGSVRFDKQVVNSSTLKEIKIFNQSRVLVLVDSVRLTGPDAQQFSLESLSFPLVLNPQDSVLSFKLTYHPLQSGLHRAQLIIFSQDIEAQMLSVSLSGIALHSSSSPLLVCDLTQQVDFASQFVGETKFVNFNLANLGNGPLTIDSVTIQSEPSSVFVLSGDLTATTIQANDTLADLQLTFTPLAAVKYSGQLIIFSNDPEQAQFSVQLSGSGKIDATPADVNLNPDSLHLVLGKQALFTVRISDDSTSIKQATLFVRPGATDQFQQLALQSDARPTWSVQLPANLLTERGLELYLKIEHGGRTTIYPENGAENPLYLAVTVPEVQFPYYTLKEKYRMFSLPFVANQTLGQLFGDDLGQYNAERYRIFDWDAQKLTFVEQTDLKTVLPPGKALYLITRDSLQLDLQNVQTVPTNQNFEMAVNNGWNMIGSPFPFNVSWAEVTKNWSLVPILFYYTGTGWVTSDVLEPFKGYAVKIQGRDKLEIPPHPFSGKMAKTALISDVQWQMQLKAKSGIYNDYFNFAGAKINREPQTVPEPPTIGSFVSLYFESQNGERLAADFRPANNSGYQFDFTVQWNTGKAAQLTIEADSLPEGWNWQLVSLNTKLKLGAPPELTLRNPQSRLRLIVGTKDYVLNNTQEFLPLPGAFKLSQNYPNPFNQSTRFQIELPEADRLTIEIFDINGRKVKTLANRRFFAPGYHRLIWQGDNNQNKTVASGLYFLRLRGTKYSAIKKLILQK